jgi:hypothetical protein
MKLYGHISNARTPTAVNKFLRALFPQRLVWKSLKSLGHEQQSKFQIFFLFRLYFWIWKCSQIICLNVLYRKCFIKLSLNSWDMCASSARNIRFHSAKHWQTNKKFVFRCIALLWRESWPNPEYSRIYKFLKSFPCIYASWTHCPRRNFTLFLEVICCEFLINPCWVHIMNSFN